MLRAVATHGCESLLALAHQLGVDRTVMTYLRDDLEQAGRVARQSDPADVRARKVAVTAAGMALLGGLDLRLRAAEERVLFVLSQSERKHFSCPARKLATDAAITDSDLTGGADVAMLPAGCQRAADSRSNDPVFHPSSVSECPDPACLVVRTCAPSPLTTCM